MEKQFSEQNQKIDEKKTNKKRTVTRQIYIKNRVKKTNELWKKSKSMHK